METTEPRVYSGEGTVSPVNGVGKPGSHMRENETGRYVRPDTQAPGHGLAMWM